MKKQTILPKIANNVLCAKMSKPLTYRGLMKTRHKPVWENALANELGRLIKGLGTQIKAGTETLVPIALDKIPQECQNSF